LVRAQSPETFSRRNRDSVENSGHFDHSDPWNCAKKFGDANTGLGGVGFLPSEPRNGQRFPLTTRHRVFDRRARSPSLDSDSGGLGGVAH
jgi:hypothetical protein